MFPSSVHSLASKSIPFLCLLFATQSVSMSTSTTSNANNNDNGIAARLARPNILELLPYRCARDDYDSGILLDANENAMGPPLTVDDHHRSSDQQQPLERYPDPYQIPLKRQLAAYRKGCNLTPAHMFVGVGSDEAIDLLLRIFCVPGRDQIVTTPPTYGMYKVCAKVNDVEIVTVPLTPDFDVRVPETLAAMADPRVKLVFLCSPGNPTSKAIPLSVIRSIATSPEARDCLVVVDEAYVDFSPEPSAVSLVGDLEHAYPNVVVLQTLSKAFGLAAIRCGFCVGAPDVIQLLNNVKAPYNLNALTSEMAIQALGATELLQKNIDAVLEQRKVVAAALTDLPFVTKVYPSDSNFLLFRLASHAKDVYKTMADAGIVTRYRGTEIHCEECIRVTIGTEAENKSFLELLQKTYASLQVS